MTEIFNAETLAEFEKEQEEVAVEENKPQDAEGAKEADDATQEGVEEEKVEAEEELSEVEKQKKLKFKEKYVSPAQKGYMDRKIEKITKQLHKQVDEKLKVYTLAIEKISSQKEQAIEDNDLKAYDQALKKEEELKSQKAIIEQEKEELADDKDQPEVEYSNEVQGWLEENSDFVRTVEADEFLSGTLALMSKKMREKEGFDKKPELEILAEVKRRAIRLYPEYFDKKKQDLPKVSAAKVATPTAKKKGWDDLAANDRGVLDSLVKMGVFKSREEALEDFIKNN